tara:strand:- start:1015 stop:2193 length:1179 start_codon:yes stop_codon:yes gene_type:complete
MDHQKLYTPAFITLCISYGFFGGSFNMIIPELPSYLESMGGKEFKGFIIALFTLTAGLSRPFSGKLTDTIGRKPIIVLGALVCIICSLIYPLLASVSGFLLLRLIHGFSTGFAPTAITAYVADIVPVHRRGEAMGIIGVSINLGSSITPPIGSHLAINYSLDVMFYASSFMALISLLLLIRIKETVIEKKQFSPSLLLLKKDEWINRDSILPALVCGLSYMGFGALITVTPDQCTYLGMENKGMFFSSFTFCAILSRLFAGRLSDIYGRTIVMRIAVVILAFSYMLFGFSASPMVLIAASGFVGFSLGIAIPVVFAWTVDRSNDDNRGKALATLFIGLEFAIGTGALLGAEIYDNNHLNFRIVFLVMGVVSLMALFFIRKDSSHSDSFVPIK